MGCGGLEGILKRQYALSGGHLAGRILILRVCSACHPGLGLQTSKRACRRRELTNPVLGAVAGRIAGTGGVTGTGQCPVRTCLGRRRADRSGRRGVTGHPEGAEREAGAAAVRFSAHAGRARICGKLVGARDRPRGTRVFAENRWARWIGHGVRVSLRRIGGRGGSATGYASGIFGARTRCPRRGDGAGISPRTPPGDRFPARTIFGFPNAAGCPAPVRQGTVPFLGRRGRRCRRGRKGKKRQKGQKKVLRALGNAAGTWSACRVRCRACIPKQLPMPSRTFLNCTS